MNEIPKRLLRDSISVQTYSGDGAYGPVPSAAVTVLGKVSMTRQLVRNKDGEEVVSEMTVYVRPNDAAYFPPESLVTADGRTSKVIALAVQGRPGEPVLARVTCG